MTEIDLSEKLDLLIERADSIDTNLARDKAERQRENRLRDRRIRFSQVAIAIALAVASFAIISARVQHDNDVRSTASRRIGFCHSLDDFGSAVKAGNVGAIQTLLDPEFAGGNSNPAQVQAFIDKFTENGAKGVDDQIVEVKQQNGFTSDCHLLKPLSTADTFWLFSLALLAALIAVFMLLFSGFVVAAKRTSRRGDTYRE